MNLLRIILLLRIIVLLICFKDARCSSETRLFAKLLENYNSVLRPVKNHSAFVDVKVDLGLTQIINMDEKQQVLIWNGWVRQTWHDYRLTWNLSEFGNIGDIAMDKDQIWTPDMALYNNAKENFQLLNAEAFEKILVQNSGHCLWMVPFVFRTICQLDITYFPFDEQKCSFEVGSWAYTGDVLNISYKKAGGDLSQYSENSAWTILKIDGDIKIGYYNCCPEPYPSIIYTMHLRRRSRYYIYKIFIPSSLIAVLAIFSFFLPTSSGERVTLLITNFASLAFYIMMLSHIVPPTSEVTPLMEMYLTAVFIVICAALILRCLIDVFKRKHRPPGWFVRRFINKYLATILHAKPSSRSTNVTTDQCLEDDIELDNINFNILSDIEVISEYQYRNGAILSSARPLQINEDDASLNQNGRFYGDHVNRSFYSDVEEDSDTQETVEVRNFNKRILSSLRITSESVLKKRIERIRKIEQDLILEKVDQLFFWVFTVAMCGTLLFIFIYPPNLVF